ncbi:MAG: DUF3108 domain-containing protein [Acidobacteriota bacterium]
MKFWILSVILLVPVSAQTLHYTISWQSGLPLGEATLRASKSAPAISSEAPAVDDGKWSFELLLDAAVPGLTIRDEYRSKADAKFCSESLEKTVTRGPRKSTEKETFDQGSKKVKRETSGGGRSEFTAPDCAHDALAFLQFVRQELAQGRLVQSQPVFLGAKYDVQVTYIGTETIRIDNKAVEADKVRAAIRGPKADVTAEILFARDAVRTPLLARLPLALGTFTVEWAE